MPAGMLTLGHGAGGGADPSRELRRERGGGRLLHDLLVAALEGAIALAQVDADAVLVAQHLHLDVAGAPTNPRGRRARPKAARLRLARLAAQGAGAHDAHTAPPPPAAALSITG